MAFHYSMTTETLTFSRTKHEVTVHKSDSYDSSTMISGITDEFHIDKEKIVDIVLNLDEAAEAVTPTPPLSASCK